MSGFLRPVAITAEHLTDEFDCGVTSLDEWLRHRALRNERTGGSRTFVSLEEGSHRVVGYVSMSASALVRDAAPGRLRRNAPDPIPVVLIGRLAVDRRTTGRGLGAALLQDAASKAISAARFIGAQAILVHAIDDNAVRFYRRWGFEIVPGGERTMFISMKDAEETVRGL